MFTSLRFRSPSLVVRAGLKKARAVAGKTVLAAVAVAGAMFVPAVQAAELVYYHARGCAYCARWEAEVLPIYHRTDEGLRAPLRQIDAADDWPGDLDRVVRPAVTPTFILVDDGQEVGRLPGYAPDFFWPYLQAMLGKLDAPAPPER